MSAAISQTQSPATVFIFAHQDDEYAVNSRIRFEVGLGNEVQCVYLTNGVGWRARRGLTQEKRDRESLAVLRSYGVRPENIYFLGSELGVNDMSLIDHACDARSRCTDLLSNLAPRISAIYTLAWEGGHPDHDACHLVVTCAALELGLVPISRQFSLYNGCGVPKPFFRVMNPLHPALFVDRQLSIREALSSSMQCWRYPSQLRTWAGLFPEAFLKWSLPPRERVMRLDPKIALARPHAGQLLYERMFERRSFEDFSQRAKHLTSRIAAMIPAH